MEKKGYIYKIVINDMIYVGSCNDLQRREKNHNYRLNNNERNNKLYQKCRENNINKLELILIEEYEYEENIELRQREQNYISELQANLNTDRAYCSKEDLKEDNRKYREKSYEKAKKYREKNKEKLSENKKIYYEKNKEKIIERIKEYSKENIEKIKVYKKKYNEKNKEKVKCDNCDSIINRGSLSTHKRTKKCMSHIKK
jgi:hypothetical protein